MALLFTPRKKSESWWATIDSATWRAAGSSNFYFSRERLRKGPGIPVLRMSRKPSGTRGQEAQVLDRTYQQCMCVCAGVRMVWDRGQAAIASINSWGCRQLAGNPSTSEGGLTLRGPAAGDATKTSDSRPIKGLFVIKKTGMSHWSSKVFLFFLSPPFQN